MNATTFPLTPFSKRYLPKPSWKNLEKAKRVLQSVKLPGFKLKYFEPSYSIDTCNWLIEYSVERDNDFRSILHLFSITFLSKFSVKIAHCHNNGKDRVSVYCRSIGADQRVRQTGTVSEKSCPTTSQPSVVASSDIKDKPKTHFKLSGHLSQYVDMQEEKQPIVASLPPKLQEQVDEYSTIVRKLSTLRVDELGSNKIEFVSGGTLFPVKSEDTTSQQPGLGTHKPEEQLKRYQPPIVKLTENSDEYAINRIITDSNLFEMVRKYLAYLGREKVNIVCTGDTRLSLGMKIVMQGLPLGPKLTEMYYEGLKRRGLTREEILSDLEAYHSYLVSIRLQHLASSEVSINRYYGLKGGQQVKVSSPLQVTNEKGLKVVLNGNVVSCIE